jgi:ABC-2 type transport system permease protein
MTVYLTLVRRELAGFLIGPTGYVVIASVLMLLGFSFVDMLAKLNGDATDAPLTQVFFGTLYFWVILLLTAPVITMRTFALEKLSGTYETLMTAPVSDRQVVLSKYLGTFLFYLLTWLPLLACLVVVRYYVREPVVFDLRTTFTTFLGIALIGSLYMAMGCLASALTRSQILAAMNTFAFGLTFFVLSLRALMPTPPDHWGSRVFAYISMTEHMQNFARGVVDTRYVVFYLTSSAFFLFLTLKVVEARRWK